jgi:thiol:disulfide interchange protein
VVVTLVALNLFGLFEITLSGRVLGTAGDLAAKEGVFGGFFNGVLATILATPARLHF